MWLRITEAVSECRAKEKLKAVFASFNKLASELLIGEPSSDQFWWDAITFFVQANKGRVGRERKSRLLRAAVLLAAGAFEAWSNFLSDKVATEGLPNGMKVADVERDFLLEQRRVLENGVTKIRAQNYPAIERFLLLFRLVSDGKPLESRCLIALKEAFKTRDRLVHPKSDRFVPVVGASDEDLFNAVLGFLLADVALADAWVEQNGSPPKPFVVH